MTFENEKKTFLVKLDKSKKGSVDEKIIPLIQAINATSDYYTTSSCSGRVYLWSGSGKKNETEWLKMSHALIEPAFLEIVDEGLIWLRLEGMIMHIACRDLAAANLLLEKVRHLYKKSCILSASNKIIVELRGSEFIEMPLYLDGKLSFSGEIEWLVRLINERMEKMWSGLHQLATLFSEWKSPKEN
ncbi:hypothetical protein HYT55_01690 [Candidatus Woesearchaeota archaeon]|nr:hypothetical protein [Candidatus Woesearchaeota archaeon]